MSCSPLIFSTSYVLDGSNGSYVFNENVHIFTFNITNSITFSVLNCDSYNDNYIANVLIVGGGGSGGEKSQSGFNGGGGGGGGEVIYNTNITIIPTTNYPVVIGSGGAEVGGSNNGNDIPGNDGGPSSIMGYTANGGKGGGYATNSVEGIGGNGGGGPGYDGKGGNGGLEPECSYSGNFGPLVNGIYYGGGGGGGSYFSQGSCGNADDPAGNCYGRGGYGGEGGGGNGAFGIPHPCRQVTPIYASDFIYGLPNSGGGGAGQNGNPNESNYSGAGGSGVVILFIYYIPNQNGCQWNPALANETTLWSRASGSCIDLSGATLPDGNNTPMTYDDLNEKRKAVIFQYKKNSAGFSKKQTYSRLARGIGRQRGQTIATQGQTYTNPNTLNLKQSGLTLQCSGVSKNWALTTQNDTPGPVRRITNYSTVPLTKYIVRRNYLAGGTKWPQYGPGQKTITPVVPSASIVPLSKSTTFTNEYYIMTYMPSNLTLGWGWTQIGSSSLQSNTQLLSIIIPPSVQIIRANAFEDATNLSSVIFSSGIKDSQLTSIEDYAFKSTKINQIIIPINVKNIATNAFQNTTYLKNVYIYHSTFNLINQNRLQTDKISSGRNKPFYGNNNNNITIIQIIIPTTSNTIFTANDYIEAGSPVDLFLGNGWTRIEQIDTSSNILNLLTVNIPSSITSIGKKAFKGAYNLTTVSFAQDSQLKEIESNAFNDCSSLIDFNIPYGVDVTSIGANSVTSIGSYAFAGCSSLTNIVIPVSVTTIGENAFKNTTNLESVTINLYSIKAMNNADISLNLPAYTISLPNKFSSFFGSGDVTYTVINGLSNADLTIFTYNNNTSTKNSNETLTSKSYNDNTTSLVQAVVGYSVLSIGSNAFSDAINLTTITFNIYSQLISIGSNAFYNASNLTSIIIPTHVTSIGQNAFSGAHKLTSITIPAKVTNIGTNAFLDSGLTEAIVNIAMLGESNFPVALGYGQTIGGNSNVHIIGYNKLFRGTGELTQTIVNTELNGASIVIIQNYNSIGSNAFYNATSLTFISIPESVTFIGQNALQNTTSLTSITVNSSNTNYKDISGILFDSNETTLIQYPLGNSSTSYEIPENVTNISSNAFSGANNLTTITFRQNSQVTTIGQDAFQNIKGLTIINIPISVTSIGFNAFQYSGLTKATINVDMLGKTYFPSGLGYGQTIGGQPNVTIVGYKVFNGIGELTTEIVTNELNNASIVFIEGYTTIGENAFQNVTSLISIIISASVTSIGKKAFYNATNLTKVNFTEGSQINTISILAFFNTPKLESITVTNSNKNYKDISGVLFNYDETTLIQYPMGSTRTTYEIPASVTMIEDYAFFNAVNLTSITIPESVNRIGTCAFYNAINLTELFILEGVTNIGENAFKKSGLITVWINQQTINTLNKNVSSQLPLNVKHNILFYGAFVTNFNVYQSTMELKNTYLPWVIPYEFTHNTYNATANTLNYQITSSTETIYKVQTTGDLDTYIRVYQYSTNGNTAFNFNLYTQIAYNDDYITRDAYLTFNASPNIIYVIVIGCYKDNVGITNVYIEQK